MATYNDGYPDPPGPLVHSSPLFQRLNILTVFDIFRLQLGIFVYESTSNSGNSKNIITFTRASHIHNYETRYATVGNFYINSVRTTRYGLKALQMEGTRLWANIPINIKEKRSKNSFKINYKNFLIKSYST